MNRRKFASDLLNIAIEIEATEIAHKQWLDKCSDEQKIKYKSDLAALKVLYDSKIMEGYQELTQNDFIRERMIDRDNYEFSGILKNKE